jgi:hypothetical protein
MGSAASVTACGCELSRALTQEKYVNMCLLRILLFLLLIVVAAVEIKYAYVYMRNDSAKGH